MKSKQPPKKGQPSAKSTPPSSSFSVLKVGKNLLLLLGAFILLTALKKNVDGYQWFAKTLIEENLKHMKKYSTLTYEQKMESKIGFNFSYLNYIKTNTPENAVILMPPDSVFFPAGEKSEFQQFITVPGWASYFVYPRTLVYEKQNNDSLARKATHVAIVNSWGYDKLPYQADRRNKYTIYPLNLNKQ